MPFDPNNAAHLTALRNEITNDPRGYGLAAPYAAGNDTEVRRLMSLVRDGTAGTVPTNPTAAGGVASGIIKLNQLTIDTGSIRAAITKSAYDGLTSGNRTWLNWLTGAGFITISIDTLQQLAGLPTTNGSIWLTADRTAMNAAMEALLRRNGSRAEELFGLNTVIDESSVALTRS